MCILICEFRPIQSVNKIQCPIHFWSSEVQLQNKSDFRLQSTHVLLHELVPVQPQRWPICSRERQSLSVHPRGVRLRQAERKPSGGLWVEWQEHRLVQGHVSRHQKLLLLLWRSPAEHCGGHPFSSDIMAVKGLRSNPHRLHRCHHQHHLALIS